MSFLYFKIFLAIFVVYFVNCQNSLNAKNQSSQNQTGVSDTINRVINDVIIGAQTAAKNLLAKNLQIDPIILKSSDAIGNSGGEIVQIALEKIVDKLNFQFYKAHTNSTYDPIREHMDYFRLSFNEKLALLMENVYNVTVNTMYAMDTAGGQSKGGSSTEAQAISLFNELFEGLGKFFEKFKNRCLHLESYKHKVEKIEHELRKLIDKIIKLTCEQKKLDSEEYEEIEEIEEKLAKLKAQFEKLAIKLFKTIDAFFKKNSHIKDREFCAYRKTYYKLKCKIIRLLKELKEIDAVKETHHEYHEIESVENSDESYELGKIESRRHFKQLVKYLLKNIEEYYRKCLEKRQKDLNEIKRNIYKIKCELVKLLKKVERESEEYSDERRFSSDSDESEEYSWQEENRHLIWRFKKLAKKFYKLKLSLAKLFGKHEESSEEESYEHSADVEDDESHDEYNNDDNDYNNNYNYNSGMTQNNTSVHPYESTNTSTSTEGYYNPYGYQNNNELYNKAPFLAVIRKYLKKN